MTSRPVGRKQDLAEPTVPPVPGPAPAPAKRGFEPRAPQRERGVVRYRELLDALEVLLETHHPDDVGIYQIAEAAKAPPASTYHFFPTREAAFVALAGRHLDRFQQGMHTPVRASAFNSWLELLARDAHASAAIHGTQTAHHRPRWRLPVLLHLWPDRVFACQRRVPVLHVGQCRCAQRLWLHWQPAGDTPRQPADTRSARSWWW